MSNQKEQSKFKELKESLWGLLVIALVVYFFRIDVAEWQINRKINTFSNEIKFFSSIAPFLEGCKMGNIENVAKELESIPIYSEKSLEVKNSLLKFWKSGKEKDNQEFQNKVTELLVDSHVDKRIKDFENSFFLKYFSKILSDKDKAKLGLSSFDVLLQKANENPMFSNYYKKGCFDKRIAELKEEANKEIFK